jgi:hypothetical protein
MSDRDSPHPKVRQLQERVTALERRNQRLQKAVIELAMSHTYDVVPQDAEVRDLDSAQLQELREAVGEETALGQTITRATLQTEGMALQTHDTEGEPPSEPSGQTTDTGGEEASVQDDATPLDDDYTL